MNSYSIKVRDDVPIPPGTTGPRPTLVIPFEQLDREGKSLEIEMPREEARDRVRAIRLRALRHSRSNNREYTVRLTAAGIGIWRK